MYFFTCVLVAQACYWQTYGEDVWGKGRIQSQEYRIVKPIASHNNLKLIIKKEKEKGEAKKHSKHPGTRK